MRRPNLWSDERGSAALEFITTGLILLVPLVYVILSLAQLQAGAFAAEGAARQAARVYVRSEAPADAEANARRAVEFALADYGVDQGAATMDVSCSPNPSDCLARRSYVTVTITVAIGLPLLPPVLTVDAPLTVPVTSTATQQVSRFRADG